MKIMTTLALEEWRAGREDFALVDVLPRESFEQKHIPGSVSAPLGAEDFIDRVEQAVHGDKDRKVVVYCAGAACDAAPRAARRLEHAGFANVFDYESGLEGWEASGHRVAGTAEASLQVAQEQTPNEE